MFDGVEPKTIVRMIGPICSIGIDRKATSKDKCMDFR